MFSFDKFHRSSADIYRVYLSSTTTKQDGIHPTDYWLPSKRTLGEVMLRDMPDVVSYARLQLPWGDNLVRAGGQVLRRKWDMLILPFFLFSASRSNTVIK